MNVCSDGGMLWVKEKKLYVFRNSDMTDGEIFVNF